MLTGGVGIDQFVSAAKQAYVKAAIAEVFPVNSRINISRLSVATGLTRKEVSFLLHKVKGRRSDQVPRAKEQRAIRVLRGWFGDPRFHGHSGQPAQLPLRGGGRAFAHLVKLYGGDVTPISVLRELQRIKAVSITKAGLLRMSASGRRLRSYAPQHMLEVARLLGDFANTVSQTNANSKPPMFFGYRDFTATSPDDAALFRRTFSRRGAALLESFGQWQASRGDARKASNDMTRVGIGVYLVNIGPQR